MQFLYAALAATAAAPQITWPLNMKAALYGVLQELVSRPTKTLSPLVLPSTSRAAPDGSGGVNAWLIDTSAAKDNLVRALVPGASFRPDLDAGLTMVKVADLAGWQENCSGDSANT